MLFLSFKPLQGQTEPRVGHQYAVAPYNAEFGAMDLASYERPLIFQL
jgi:hypothetical protein